MNRFLTSCLGGLFLLAILAGPLSSQEPVKPKVTSHDLAGKENCMMCHAVGVMPPAPDVPAETHEGRGNETCQWCHAADSPMQTVGAKAAPHQRATADTDCMSCHGPGANAEATDTPETHKGRENNTCLWCHTKAVG